MLGLNPWLSLLVVVLALLLARLVARDTTDGTGAASTSGVSGRIPRALARAVGSRSAPWIAGLLTGALTWFVWGSLARTAVVHDEAAYLLQAQIFARFAWTAPLPPIPHFFEQLYVNLAPAVYSKYPPGTSLLLTPGVWLGLPGLPVILINSITGALLFAVARRIAGGFVALLAWTFWITSFPVLYFHAMYLSEVPSSMAWLGAWWGLLRWRESTRAKHLWIVAISVALCGVTRPLTGVALALSAGVYIALVTARRDGLRAPTLLRVARPFAATAACAFVLVMLWSWQSTGDPRVTPLALYTRSYVPFDRLGFGARDDERPSARLPWDQRVTSESFYEEHRLHTVSSLPIAAYSRARMIAHDMWYDWRGGLAALAVVGLIGAPAALWFGLGALALQLVCYLLYAHPWTWSLYYIETLPALAILTAVGIARAHAFLSASRTRDRGMTIVVVVLVLAVLYPAVRTVGLVRGQIAQDHAYHDAFARLLPHDPNGAIVFVRYAPAHNDGLSLVRNQASPGDAPVWTAYDRGAENARLAALAPRRTLYLFDEASWSLRPLGGITSQLPTPR